MSCVTSHLLGVKLSTCELVAQAPNIVNENLLISLVAIQNAVYAIF